MRKPIETKATICRFISLVVWLASSNLVLAEDCVVDSDCETGHTCDKAPIGIATSTCAPGEDCSAPGEEIQYGNCEPDVISCRSDADCPSPLKCLSDNRRDCASDGQINTCENADNKVCTWDVEPCSSDDDCAKGYECVNVNGASCEGAPLSEISPCLPGEDGLVCPSSGSGSVPVEEECEVEELLACFPRKTGCTDDAECQSGWQCIDFSKLELVDLEEETYAGPPWWDDGKESKAVACMPKGLTLFFEGHAQVSGVVVGSDAATTSANTAKTTSEKSSDGAETVPNANGDSGGCTISRCNRNSGGQWLLLPPIWVACRKTRRYWHTLRYRFSGDAFNRRHNFG
jgi:hypothetical protein